MMTLAATSLTHAHWQLPVPGWQPVCLTRASGLRLPVTECRIPGPSSASASLSSGSPARALPA
eukprot:512260-Rhodomonas_salina.4